MFKKVGMVTVGITAGLLAAAPLASAGEAPHDSGHSHSHDGDHHKKKNHGGGDSCDFAAGDAKAGGSVSGDSFAGNLLTQAPVGGANAANIACNDILNGNLNGNNLSISVLGADDEEPVTVQNDAAAADDEDAPAAAAPALPI